MAGPGGDEADVVGDGGADVFDDEGGDEFGLAGGELVGVDAAEGTAEEDSAGKSKMREESFEVADVVGAGVGSRVAGVAVAALIESEDAPFGRERVGKREEGCGFHEMAVKSDERVRGGTGVKVGEGEAGVGEGGTGT